MKRFFYSIKRYYKRLITKQKQTKQIQLFEGLGEMWLFNWNKLNETNDLRWIISSEEDRKLCVEDKDYISIRKLDDRFLELMDEWFELTDANSSRKELYVLIKKLIAARNKVIQGDLFQQNWVNRFEKMINDLTSDNVGFDPDKERMRLSAEVKMMIDSKTITVRDYHFLLEVTAENIKNKTPQEDGQEGNQ